LSLAYVNGEFLPIQEASVSVLDRGFAYGDGVFTTIKVAGGTPLLLSWHLERLELDATALFIPAPAPEELEEVCCGLVERLGMEEGVVKIVLTRGVGERGLSARGAGDPTVVITASVPPIPRPPLRAVTLPDRRGSLVVHKTLNYLPNILALRQAELAGCEEAVFVKDGSLLESTVSNLVGLVDGELITPASNGDILCGVARRRLLESGTVAEGRLAIDTRGPLYCVNAVRGVEVVAELDGRRLRKESCLERALRETL
jgi:branched-chain amino acid aminotransferase